MKNFEVEKIENKCVYVVNEVIADFGAVRISLGISLPISIILFLCCIDFTVLDFFKVSMTELLTKFKLATVV